MTANEYRQAKRSILTIFALTVVLLFLFLCIFIKKENAALSAEQLRAHAESAQELCIRMEETTYLLPGGASTAAVFEGMKKTKARPEAGRHKTLSASKSIFLFNSAKKYYGRRQPCHSIFSCLEIKIFVFEVLCSFAA